MRPSVRYDQGFRFVRKDLANESLYSRLCSHYCVEFTDTAEVRIAVAAAATPLFGPWSLGLSWLSQIAELLRCEVLDVAGMLGEDICRPMEMAKHLRFCRRCMLVGYHSILFQHRALSRCPWHGEPLLEACPSCGQAIVPTLRMVRKDPYLCPSCTRPLSSLRTQRAAREDPLQIDAMLTPKRRALSRAQLESQAYWKADESWPAVHPTVRARQVHRSVLVGQSVEFGSPWRYLTTEHEVVPIRDENGAPRKGQALVRDLEPLLRWFSVNCPGADEVRELLWAVGKSSSGVRRNRDISLLAVVLFRTLSYFDLVGLFDYLHRWPEENIPMREGDQLPVRTSPTVWGNPLFDARIAQLEVLGLFALLAARARPGSPLLDVDWRVQVNPVEFTPSWSYRREHGQAWGVLRWRADERMVKRLFRRYASARYVRVPDEELDKRLGMSARNVMA